MNDILKPCPFCGGRADSSGSRRYVIPPKDQTWADGSPITDEFFVSCTECGLAHGSKPIGGFQTTALAIEAWNKRAIDVSTNWEPSFLASPSEQGCIENQWKHLATRYALLHDLARGTGNPYEAYLDLAAEYSLAGPEFCTAILERHESRFEVPF